MVERYPDKIEVDGSIPSLPTKSNILIRPRKTWQVEVHGSNPCSSTWLSAAGRLTILLIKILPNNGGLCLV